MMAVLCFSFLLGWKEGGLLMFVLPFYYEGVSVFSARRIEIE